MNPKNGIKLDNCIVGIYAGFAKIIFNQFEGVGLYASIWVYTVFLFKSFGDHYPKSQNAKVEIDNYWLAVYKNKIDQINK